MRGFLHSGLFPRGSEFSFSFTTSRFVTVTLCKLIYSQTHSSIRSVGSDLSATFLQDEDRIAVCFRLDCGPLLESRKIVLSRKQSPGQHYFAPES